MIKAFGLALTFLTILPAPRSLDATPAELAQSMLWFPVVGLLLGLMLWVAGLGLTLFFPDLVVSALLLILLVLLTGGLHLDGLADTLDGLGGGKNPAARLRIMKDSALGAFGVVGLILVLLVKFTLFAALIEKAELRALCLFPVVSRWSLVGLAYLSSYARPEGGLGEAMTTLVSGRHFGLASLSAVLLVLATYRLRGLVALGLVALSTWLASQYFQRRLGGITGDVCGAVNEWHEVLALLVTVV